MYSFKAFSRRFPDDLSCLQEIKNVRYPQGVTCPVCKKVTKHYKLHNRTAYSCSVCRHQLFPLTETIFEKTTTPLRLWFFCMFLMSSTRGKITAKQLERELHVTYKTAWRMRKCIFALMKQNRADLLAEPEKVLSISFFNAFEVRFVQKQDASS